MADIFVGSVAVGVVPDARGWNEKLRAQLVPSADAIGTEYGKTMGRKISDSMGKAGDESGGAFGDNFRKRVDAALKALPKAKLDGDSTAIDRKLEELRRKMEEISKTDIVDPKKALKDLAVIQAELDKVSRKSKDIRVSFNTAEARAQLDLLSRDISSKTGPGLLGRIAGRIGNVVPGLQGTGGGASGVGALASSGGSAFTNPYVLGGSAAAIAAVAPFAGQALGGLGVFGLGAGLAGLGAAGAAGLGTTPAASQVQLAAASQAVTNAQLRQQSAQANLNKLEASGKATALQLAQAHASLSTAQQSAAASQVKLTAMQKQNLDATTKGQLAVRKAFSDLKVNAIADLTKIGVAFIPVLENIAGTAGKVLGKLTPVFAGAMKVIAGPVERFADTILNAFNRPAVIKSIQDIAGAFGKILDAFTPDIPGIADSLAQAISRMASAVAKNPKAFADFLDFLFQIVIAVIDAVAWLTVFANYLEFHFVPGIVRAWHFLGDETVKIWNLIYENTVGVIIRLGHNVETQFNSISNEIAVIFDGIRHDIAHTWDQIYDNTIGAVIRVWQKVNTPFANMRHDIAGHMDGIRHDIAHYWDLIFQDTIGRVIRLVHNVEVLLDQMRLWIAGTYDIIRHYISSAWDLIWSNTVGRALRGASDLMGVFTGLKNRILSWFSDTVRWLVNAGSNIIGGLFNGMKLYMSNIGNWIKNNVVDPVINSVKHFFGISSPAAAMVPIGINVMAGLMKGLFSGGKDLTHFIKNVFGGMPAALGNLVTKGLVDISKLPQKALSALGSVAGKVGGFFAKLFGGSVGGGVQRWAGVVAQALSMLGLPLGLGKRVLYQMQTESGGNQNAINLTDINAQQGDPSRGLLQTIGATFAAYHVPGTSNNIYDPLANVAAAINYAQHVYGPSLMRGGMGMGSGHGYDTGGWWPPNTIGWNTSGKHELVVTQEQLRAGALAGGSTAPEYHAHFDGLTGQAIESHVQVAFTAMSLTQGHLSRQGRRS